MKNQEHCRLETEDDYKIIKSIEAHIDYLQQELKAIEQSISNLCQEDGAIKNKISQLTSIPGVGHTLAIATICYAPALGLVHLNKLTSLIGLAPFARESGTYKRRFWIRGWF